MLHKARRLALILALIAALPLVLPASAAATGKNGNWWQDDWNATVFGGRVTTDNSSDIAAGRFGFEKAGSLGLGIGKRLLPLGEHLSLDAEAQFVRHFGDQRHWETNGVVMLRWHSFPWDRWLDTNAAIGSGLSYPSEIPELESRRRPDDSTRLLHYLFGEVAFSLPERRDWEFLLRYQHRSGTFGTFGGVHEASTTFAIGLRRHF